jgi:LmbE family N-acetylglucosaminyl deacetylase
VFIKNPFRVTSARLVAIAWCTQGNEGDRSEILSRTVGRRRRAPRSRTSGDFG